MVHIISHIYIYIYIYIERERECNLSNYDLLSIDLSIKIISFSPKSQTNLPLRAFQSLHKNWVRVFSSPSNSKP